MFFYFVMTRTYYKEEALFRYDEVIEVGDKFHLEEIIPKVWYEKWFAPTGKIKGKIFVLNKGRCGNGGTTGFINYARDHCKGLLVSVPNRSIVMSKEAESKRKDDDLCCVYGGAENIDKDRHIRVCTWDKTESVEDYPDWGFVNGIDFMAATLEELNRVWAGSLLVVDEYHKLIADSSYRSVCGEMVEHIITTDSNVMLMSATPDYEFIEFLRMFSGKEVETYNVQYDDEGFDKKGCALKWMDRPKGLRLYDIVMEVVDKARMMREEFKECSAKVRNSVNQVIFFYNSVKEISHLVNNMPDTSDVEVLCAKTEKNELTCPCYSEQFSENKLIHFMTSAYFTGMDATGYIDKIVFIGGNSLFFLSYSNKDIKQAIGRARNGNNGVFVIPDGRAVDKMMYASVVAKRKTAEDKVKKYQKYAGDADYVRDFLGEIIQWHLDYMYYNNIVESMEGWKDFESFKKMMSVYKEYDVKAEKMKKPKQFKKKRDISFKMYKEKRLKGEKVAYKYAGICEKFIEKYGIEKFAKTTRPDIERKMELEFAVGDVDLDSMSGEEMYEFLLGDNFYTGSYLMSVLDFLGEKCKYDDIEKKMNEVFGCYCVCDTKNKDNLGSSKYLCLLTGNFTEKGESAGHASIYRSVSHEIPQNRKTAQNIKVSRKVSKPNQKTQAITEYLGSTNFYSMINAGDFDFQKELYTKIFKDVSVLPNLKRDGQYKKLLDECKRHQTMISEFYKDAPSSVKYPHKAEEMDKIDCLIVDIDDSISFNEFKEIYSDMEWTAYPTISNPDADNWRKFRAIIPLAQTLSIPNENLNTLKLLRRMVCKYEDKCHNLGSNINAEQWEMRYHNEGEVVDISQDTVTYLHTLLQNMATVSGKFRKSKKDNVVVNVASVTNEAIERAVKMITEAKEGNRHATIYGQMWKLMTIFHINDEQINYIREQIADNEKIKEFDEQVKYIYKASMR